MRNTRLVIFDMDGVLVRPSSSWEFVHRRLGTSNEDGYLKYMAGEIDDFEFIRADVSLWREAKADVTLQDILSILDEVELQDGFRETMSALGEAGVPRAMISGGLQPLADRVAKAGGISPALANDVVADGGGALTGEGVVNVRVREKGGHVAEVIDRLSLGGRPGKVVCVGDSPVDVHMFWAADLGIAFNPRDDYVRENSDVVVEGNDLRDIIRHLP